METSNPYAPPKAAVADLPTGLKQRRVLVMIVFTIVTFGIYYLIWFFRRRKALNALNSARKVALWPLLLFSVTLVVEFVLGIVSAGRPIVEAFGTMPAALFSVGRLVTGLLMVWQCFVIKDIIEDHLAGLDDGTMPSIFVERVQLSGLATFFFSIFYLQYAINRDLARLQPATPVNLDTVEKGHGPGPRIQRRDRILTERLLMQVGVCHVRVDLEFERLAQSLHVRCGTRHSRCEAGVVIAGEGHDRRLDLGHRGGVGRRTIEADSGIEARRSRPCSPTPCRRRCRKPVTAALAIGAWQFERVVTSVPDQLHLVSSRTASKRLARSSEY
jgi:hypothetical protein